MRTNRILPKFERKVFAPINVDRSMESRVKSLGVAIAVALCSALTVGPALAQEQAPKAGSDRDAPRADGIGTGAMKGEADAKSGDAGGDRGAGQTGPREGDAVHASSAVHAGPGAVANRKGATAAAGMLGAPSSNQGVTMDHGINSIRPGEGLTGLQRRANRRTLIANAPKMPVGPSANTGIGTPFTRLGADGAAARNAIGITVPGGRSTNHDVSADHAGIGASVPGVSGVAATGNVGGANLHRPAIPLNAVTGPAAQTAGINGTTMGHVGSGPNYIGGPAKDRSGINGTAMRPKH
jgi:hypothetical protein